MHVVCTASRAINRLWHTFLLKPWSEQQISMCVSISPILHGSDSGKKDSKTPKESNGSVCNVSAGTYSCLCTCCWVSKDVFFFLTGEVWENSDIRDCWQVLSELASPVSVLCADMEGLLEAVGHCFLCRVNQADLTGGEVVHRHTPACELRVSGVFWMCLQLHPEPADITGEGKTLLTVWECTGEWEMMARGCQKSARKDFLEHALEHWEQLPLPRGCSWQVKRDSGWGFGAVLQSVNQRFAATTNS